MNIGGVGGTGKSRVLTALQDFVSRRNEVHRFVTTAPTGSAACLINGSTYHSVLNFNGLNDYNTSATVLGKVRERLEFVDVLFLDEISMVSCTDLYKICSQMCKAMNNDDLPFGGKHVMVAGDFGQLPPAVNVRNSLYSDKVKCSVDGLNLQEQHREGNMACVYYSYHSAREYVSTRSCG